MITVEDVGGVSKVKREHGSWNDGRWRNRCSRMARGTGLSRRWVARENDTSRRRTSGDPCDQGYEVGRS